MNSFPSKSFYKKKYVIIWKMLGFVNLENCNK